MIAVNIAKTIKRQAVMIGALDRSIIYTYSSTVLNWKANIDAKLPYSKGTKHRKGRVPV